VRIWREKVERAAAPASSGASRGSRIPGRFARRAGARFPRHGVPAARGAARARAGRRLARRGRRTGGPT